MSVPPTLTPIRLGVWGDFRLQLAWAYEWAPEPEYRRHAYIARFQAAWLIRKGTVTLSFGGEKEHYSAGVWVFPRGIDGWQEFSEDATLLCVRFLAEWPTGESLFDRHQSHSMAISELKEFTRISERLVRSVNRDFPGVASSLPFHSGSLRQHLSFQRLLYGWFLAYVGAMERFGLLPNALDRLDERIRTTLHRMEIQPLDRPLSEQELAKRSGLSVSQFNKLFVRDLGKTPKEYWEERRVHAVLLGLLDTSRSIKSIALDLGFHSQSHFSSWCTKKLGKSPRAFRETSNQVQGESPQSVK